MLRNILINVGLTCTVFYSSVYAETTIPTPPSWSFPQVIESARAITPNNIEGKLFNRFGLVYASVELKKLTLSNMLAKDLKNMQIL